MSFNSWKDSKSNQYCAEFTYGVDQWLTLIVIINFT